MINKKTALDDNATIYQKDNVKSNKEKFEAMSKDEKWQYFRDYYLKKVVISIIAVIMVIFFLKDSIFNRTTEIMSIALLDGITITDSTNVQSKLKELLNITDEDQVINITSLTSNDTKLSVLMGANALDLMVMPEETFNHLCKIGALSDLSTVLTTDEYNMLQDKLVNGQVIETDINGEELSRGLEAPYGIKIDGSSLLNGMISYSDNIYLALLVGCENIENAKSSLIFLSK